MKKYFLPLFFLFSLHVQVFAQKSLHQLQQEFIDLRFGMFIHFNIPTYMDEDWADPDASPSIFNPKKLDCSQWAKAAKSAKMTFGCLTTKHHSGFCIWDTKTTDYNVMNSPFKRDVVKEYVDAFRAQGLGVMLYYSILDTHHKIRPGYVSALHVEMIKAQLTELFTNYGEIAGLVIDGWDAPWSRISYDEIPFEDIYLLVKSLQPNCLITEHNAAKYPEDGLFYSDIKTYEQNAGQYISKETNKLPAVSNYPINKQWFWKTDFPTTPVKDPAVLVKDHMIPLNAAYCNLLLNVAPNRDGLIDDNALTALKEIGRLWKNDAPKLVLPPNDAPIISSNIAKHKPSNSSWGNDMDIMDFANDDNYYSSWRSNEAVKQPWYEVELGVEQDFNTIVIVEADKNTRIRQYRIEYYNSGQWKPLLTGNSSQRICIHRFERVWGAKVRMWIDQFDGPPGIAEFSIYNERR